ncbi:MAG: GGDEF domain-containing protein, partial [Planctomycetaceae bacterium]|nr:GGDEF domain-containing protein [Planctomycetaceae bacterium]
REISSRMLFVGAVGWVSLCLLAASWFPQFSEDLRILWMLTGVTGLVSAVGLADLVKSDQKAQEALLGEYAPAATLDGLTGLVNRQSLDNALAGALGGFDPQRNPLSIMMFDVDHFKEINDEHGHEAGDEVLRCLAQKAASFFKKQGCVARYGGEEFAVVLPGVRMKEAFHLADHFRKLVEQTVCPFRESLLQVRISAGVTETKRGESGDDIIRRADSAVATAKKMGRNCVWFGETASDMIPEMSGLSAS